MRTVVITGVSRGIGRALAEKFLQEGYFVIGTSTSGKAEYSHENFAIFQLDLANPESIETCARQIMTLSKSIDVLINNAGVVLEEPGSKKVDIGALKKTMDINAIGPIHFTELLAVSLNNGAHVINISSRQGSFNFPVGSSTPSYKISKAALNMFTRVLSYQLEGKAIVSSIHPGAVKTDMAGPDADMEPEEAAQYIYDLAISKPETGQFWFKGEKFPW
jgi:NAD(P)-dependent dehydrogenase (short-subunit alcohol dehydrogenase family)